MKISFSSKGNFKLTDSFLTKISRGDLFRDLDGLGQEGVNALKAATPVNTGLTAASWGYKIKVTRGAASIEWTNSHIVDGVPIAIILQYGHGTGTGGYIQGKNYINPAIKPVFDKIANKAWKAVTSA